MADPRQLHDEADQKEAQAKQFQDEANQLRDEATRSEVELLAEAAYLDRLARDKKYDGADEARDISLQADEVCRRAKGV